jgi:hypothetical protein
LIVPQLKKDHINMINNANANQSNVIFTAFANPKGDLANLNREQNGIQDALMPLEQQGKLKKHLLRTDTDLDAYFDFIRQWKNQISIFHYGGHANSEGLSLQNAHTFFEPLAKELTERNKDSLVLVVLNGCSTFAHIKTLFALGVKAVIATSVDINDASATNFAIQFYKNIANNDELQTAYSSAANYTKSSSTAQKYRSFGEITRSAGFEHSEKDDNPDTFPWGLYIQDETVLNHTFFSQKETALKESGSKTIHQTAEKIYNIEKIDIANFS